MDSVTINFQGIIIKVVAPNKHIELIKAYFPGLVSYKVGYYKYYIKVVFNKNIKFNLPEKFAVKKLFSGQTYFIWKKDNIIKGIAEKSKNCAQHIINVTGRDFIIYVSSMENINYLICIIREILIKELLSLDYIPIHASAVVSGGNAYCFFGEKGSGKSVCFFSLVNRGAKPLSNDLVFVKKISNKWQAVGWPFCPSINKNFFDLGYIGNEKVKYTPNEFCKLYKTSWVWQSELEKLIYIKFKKNQNKKIKLLSQEELDTFMQKYAKEERWVWEDAFCLGDNFSEINYNEISKEIEGFSLEGNIIHLFKNFKGEIHELFNR